MSYDTWVFIGLIVIPGISLIVIMLDMFSAYGDWDRIAEYYAKKTIEYEQAKHNFLAQTARAVSMFIILSIAGFYFLEALDRNILLVFFYILTLSLAADSIRARVARRRMLRMVLSYRHNNKNGSRPPTTP